MNNFYGVRATRKHAESGNVSTAKSGIVVALGTAPVNQVETQPKSIVKANDFKSAKAALGYSDDWGKFTLCEVMHTYFNVYGTGPVLFINVATLDDNKKAVAAAEYPVVGGQVELPESTVGTSIVVTVDEEALVRGTDYEVFYSGGKCIVEAVPKGGMSGKETVEVAYDNFEIDMESMVQKVIGNYDTETGVSTGLELIDSCYALCKETPDLIIAPGFSEVPDVATAMTAKTGVNTLFRAKAISDGEATETTLHSEAVSWKQKNGMCDENQIVCWPRVKNLDGSVGHISTHLAALIQTVDAENDGCPDESPSNKELKIAGTCLEDGTEVVMTLEKANYLRGGGIVTAINMAGGFKAWGNYTACYPENQEPEYCMIPIARTFDWVSNSLILNFWSHIDKKLNRRLCETIVDSANLWLNNLTNAGHLYGARVELLAEENPDEDLASGIIRPHAHMTPPAAAQEINWIVEYDASYASDVLG